ncbi:hypothetical protein GCM10025782_20710 [Pedococcus ginsenosidimutans]|uniref:Helix-turn-helix domain-containing protein n=1 Tax=Pedococcus ginsenosidimutans TaxID=490570 RepID=A0ABP8Y6R5_9MICO
MDLAETGRISLTLNQAASAVGFSAKTLRGAIASGGLIAHRATDAPNSKFIVLVEDLRTWVENLPFAK